MRRIYVKHVRSAREGDYVGELQWSLKAAGLPEGELEYRFHPERRWRFDLAFPDHMLAVEVDGGRWTGGRHVSGVGVEKDAEKYSHAAILGWRVIRLVPDHVRDGRALSWIEAALRYRA